MPSDKPIIAIVENDQSLLKALARLISAFGYQIEIYASAEEFLHRSEITKLACLVLDINLDGISGLALQKHLRNEEVSTSADTTLPVIFISGRDDVATIGEAVDYGCVAYLHKPVDSSTLRRLLSNLLA
ncbi:response regulator transcription factor [Undibacterium flavidum]|uniref:Response regulator n=1 Tax=Undibacterium flavidum TaxID=2762297 RepID=A0ABR6YAU8_9BURK|nr:response regulator [Undibacterium flavidum]MBC3873763.1 response regulator [Undibacterium flavidum]